jgi:hypothetical protein
MQPGQDAKAVFLMSPSVSPIFRNNPGYSVIDLTCLDSQPKVIDYHWRFLEFSGFIKDTSHVSISTVQPMVDFGVDINDYKSVRRMDNFMLLDHSLYLDFMRKRVGNSVMH